MRKLDLAQRVESGSTAHAVARGCALPATVQRHHGSVRERRGVKGAGGVGGVVRDEMPLCWAIGMEATKAGLEMVRRAAGQVTWGIDDRGEEERIPG